VHQNFMITSLIKTSLHIDPEEAKKQGLQPAPSFVIVILPNSELVRVPCIVAKGEVSVILGTIPNGSDVETSMSSNSFCLIFFVYTVQVPPHLLVLYGTFDTRGSYVKYLMLIF
jgi:hypothetical protein